VYITEWALRLRQLTFYPTLEATKLTETKRKEKLFYFQFAANKNTCDDDNSYEIQSQSNQIFSNYSTVNHMVHKESDAHSTSDLPCKSSL